VSESLDRREIRILTLIVGLTALRLVIAAFFPLAFDEAYYWRWSLHLAPGYFDHPPMVAAWIAAGRFFLGDTHLGVRLFFILSALPATWAVWRTAAILTQDRRIAATAALYFNLTLFILVGTMIATPDTPLLLAASFIALFLAKLIETGKGGWWLAVGAAVGFGLLSKYTALFFGPSILIAMLLLPDPRKWLATPWPWIGGVLAFAIFAPTILWNATHDWISFRFQFGRATGAGLHPQYVAEYAGALFGMATPSVFVLGVLGLAAIWRGQGTNRNARVILGALIWPLTLYFLWHSLRGRVEGNWVAPVFPALAIVAAIAAHGIDWRSFWEHLARFAHRTAVPVALFLAGVIYLQALIGVIPIGPRDPTARILGAGMADVATEVEQLREMAGAKGILTPSYALTGWLSFYLPRDVPVVQIGQRYRWYQEPEPAPDIIAGPLIYIDRSGSRSPGIVSYRRIEEVAQVTRRRGATIVEEYELLLVSDPDGDPLDRSPPARR
jgi:4-amino-4-deoxy-L-arabinose transferase-like glycosyltransferase